MSAVLMDTNALIWFMNGDPMAPASLAAIAAAQSAERIYISPISAWEAALALRKRVGAPSLGGRDARDWFRAVMNVPGTKLVSPGRRIAFEAATVPAAYDSGDPGDCFLIATARVKRVPIVTRDRQMAALAARHPRYLDVIVC